MPNFIALISAESCCDYSIVGCGKKWLELNAQTHSDALLELRRIIIGEISDDTSSGRDGRFFWKEQRLTEVILLEVSAIQKLPIGDWYKSADAELAEARNAKKEAEERQLYERLKAKFK